MHRASVRVVLGLTIVGCGLLAAQPARAQQYQKFQNLSTGYCLRAPWEGNAYVDHCGSTWLEEYWKKNAPYGNFAPDNQYFNYYWSETSSGWSGSPVCLGVANASKTHNANVMSWACNSSKDQFWNAVLDAPTGCYVFYNYNSGLVMGVAGGSTADGAPVIQWEDLHTQAGHRDQLWCPFTP